MLNEKFCFSFYADVFERYNWTEKIVIILHPNVHNKPSNYFTINYKKCANFSPKTIETSPAKQQRCWSFCLVEYFAHNTFTKPNDCYTSWLVVHFFLLKFLYVFQNVYSPQSSPSLLFTLLGRIIYFHSNSNFFSQEHSRYFQTSQQFIKSCFGGCLLFCFDFPHPLFLCFETLQSRVFAKQASLSSSEVRKPLRFLLAIAGSIHFFIKNNVKILHNPRILFPLH